MCFWGYESIQECFVFVNFFVYEYYLEFLFFKASNLLSCKETVHFSNIVLVELENPF